MLKFRPISRTDGGNPLSFTYLSMKSRIACCFSVSMGSFIPYACSVCQLLLVCGSAPPYRLGRGNALKERGVALILALLVLSFLTILGGALLTTSTIDIWISDNYKTSNQNLYIAEAGLSYGREILRTSSATPSQLLSTAAGPDHQLSSATDLATLLASDDQPLIPSDPALRA